MKSEGKMIKKLATTALFLGLVAPAQAEQEMELDEISVTATRLERKSSEVPAAVTIVSSETIEETKQFNVKELLVGTPGVLIESSNQGYDSRLIIRGAGLKARYGVREIMVLRDGVPVTDPDSFTRLDMIDTQMIEQVEVVKGPNSTLWGANSAGGVINIISKNPLERSGGNVRLAGGEFDTGNIHFSYADDIDSKIFYSGSFSHRQTDNSWRRWNEFETTQVSLQPNVAFDNGAVLENMISYSKADLQLPGSLNEEMFNEYLKTGEAEETDGAWQFSGRYSESYYVSSKLTMEKGDFTVIPLVYFNIWDHNHPVTGRVNNADTTMFGTDLQVNFKHKLGTMPGTITTGFTGRVDSQETDYYAYEEYDTVASWSGAESITEVFSDKAGEKLEEQSRDTVLLGLYLQESLNLTDRLIMDVGVRYDHIEFDIESTLDGEYDWSSKNYVMYNDFDEDDWEEFLLNNPEFTRNPHVEKSYDAFSPRIGLSYGLTDALNVFVSVSSGVQTPTEGEISDNPDLDLVKVKSYEVGLKGRDTAWSFDTSVYVSPVENEVVQVLQEDGISDYVNAGKTDKKGFEFAGSLKVLEGLTLGANYSYTDYTFDDFTETVGWGNNAQDIDRSGNTLPFVPEHQYSFTANYRHESGFKCNIQSLTWGEYYMDNANSEKYEGYELITNLMLGYEWQNGLDLSINVDNLFDKQYATEVKKDTSGDVTYKPAAPQSIIARLSYKF